MSVCIVFRVIREGWGVFLILDWLRGGVGKVSGLCETELAILQQYIN